MKQHKMHAFAEQHQTMTEKLNFELSKENMLICIKWIKSE